MADDDQEDNQEQDESPKKSGKKKLILIIVGVVLLIALSVGGTLAAMHFLAPEPPAEEALIEGEEAEVDNAEEDEVVIKSPAIYFPLKPPIIVNFQARGRQRFLQAELTLMAREEDVIQAIELHMPTLRHNLVILFGGQVYEELQTDEGKELLRQSALLKLQEVMEKEIGKKGIEQILFTNFVMQ